MGRPLSTAEDSFAHQRVYVELQAALAAGRFTPGQRLTLRSCADTLGVSPMPVRDALRRLVAEGALIGAANRSVRVPELTRAKILEMRDVRLALEGLAAERAAMNATEPAVRELEAAAEALYEARRSGHLVADMEGVRRFHFTLYASAGMPSLLDLIGSAWLRVGTYRHLLYPDYVSKRDGRDTRQRIVAAFAARDGTAVRSLLCGQIADSMTWAANRLGEAKSSTRSSTTAHS